MDLSVLKKKLSVYKDQKGGLKRISDELLHELLVNWESWDGSSASFYSALGTNSQQMAPAIGRAKRFKREGRFGSAEFREAVVDGQPSVAAPSDNSGGRLIEFVWPDGRLIRFNNIDCLVEFLRRSA